MYNPFRSFYKQIPLFLSDEPFTKREAWIWLIANSTHGKVSCSVRYIAKLWKWHKSKVERFLQRLKSESLIETEIKSGKLVITICNYEHFITSAQTTETISETISESIPNQNRYDNRYSEAAANYALSENTETISRQNRYVSNCTNADARQTRDNNRDTKLPANSELSENAETISRQNRDSGFEQEEEKKKRTKKRKEEEFLKEKNIPYGDTKKEKFIPFHLVQESDVADWVEEVLPIEIDLTWELGKFKDYWLTARKKPPKHGVAAFRSWLRKSLEINNGGKIERFNNKTAKYSTGFERFLTGGARALAKLEQH